MCLPYWRAGHSSRSRPMQKLIYHENTCRNIPRTYLTDKTKPPYQCFFICPFPQALLCPVLEKIWLFLLQCVTTLLLCYLSREQAAGESQPLAGTKRCCSCTRALSHQVLHPSQRENSCFSYSCPFRCSRLERTWREIKSPRGVGRQYKFCGWTLAPGWWHSADKVCSSLTGTCCAGSTGLCMTPASSGKWPQVSTCTS